MKTTRLSLLVLAGALAACNAQPKNDTTPPAGQPPETTFQDHWTQANPTDQGPGTLDPTDLREGKATRRLTVSQLRKSIPALFNGITWTTESRNNPQPMFNTLSRTLGEADYLQVTTPNTEPTPLFAKFMDDMAGQVCGKAVAADVMNPQVMTRMVMPYEMEPERNLRFLRLKLHGIYVPDTSMDGLADLKKLYDDVLADTNQDRRQAWTAVCVAMLSAPELMAY